MADKITIKAECVICGGTGLYKGIFEPRDAAIPCGTCSGTGCHVIKYVPFKGRKTKRGIKTVLVYENGVRKQIPYEDFIK